MKVIHELNKMDQVALLDRSRHKYNNNIEYLLKYLMQFRRRWPILSDIGTSREVAITSSTSVCVYN